MESKFFSSKFFSWDKIGEVVEHSFEMAKNLERDEFMLKAEAKIAEELGIDEDDDEMLLRAKMLTEEEGCYVLRFIFGQNMMGALVHHPSDPEIARKFITEHFSEN